MNVTKNRTKMSLTSYVFDFSSFITPRNSGDTNWATLLPIFATSEVPAMMAGIDFGVDHNLWRNFWVRSNLNYVYGEIKDEDSPLPMIPPFNGLLAFEYRSQDFNFGLKSEFASAQHRTDRFEEPTDSYIIFGIDANYNFLYNGVYNSIYFSIENIFDTVYYNHLSRIKSIFPEFGINFRISYKLIL
jgi:iron complex outermembrane receptor protein